ncbi:MAG: hypothetical protein QOJ94_2736 [Sphingomonadales bacterium]|jgi:hypothetical protein|nr:hypothetical protein [Sphingomonadales bacterium]
MTIGQPSVSLVIVAYNQERYISDAVEGAFAQTYAPLEIVLSDDRSTDRTADIMARMAADYAGPHRVRFVANPQNLGIVQHVFARGREASGDIVVIAAGDDISLPRRAAALAEIFRQTPDALAVTSGYHLIDEDGGLLEANRSGNVWGAAASARSSFVAGVPIGDYVEIQGSTASYRRTLFETRLPPAPLLFSEDNLLNFLAYLYGGRVVQSAEALVRYRRHSAALGNRPQARDPAIQEQEAVAAARVRENKMLAYRWIAANNPHVRELDHAAVDEEIRAARLMSGWPEKRLPARLAALAAELLRHRGKMAKWQAGRLFGRYPYYQPKRMLASARQSPGTGTG